MSLGALMDADLDFPLHSPDFYRGDPYPAFAALRSADPVHWHEEGGFWALLKYEDIRWVSRRPEQFINGKGVIIPDPEAEAPVESQAGSLVSEDPPRHRRLRKLINKGFTPRRVAELEPKIRQMARDVVSDLELGTEIDFADAVAAPLPVSVIADLLGAPTSDWKKFREWSDQALASSDPDVEGDPMEARIALHEYFSALLDERRREPRDDLMSILLNAEMDGERLTGEEVYNFTWLLLIAGNETTRNLISLGMLALIDNPLELKKLQEDPKLIPVAVEEMLRYTTPVTHMARTATEDVEIRGRAIHADDVVVMLYGSANRDEEIFGADAEEFRVDRDPNPHLSFGFGEHLCLGASLARLEARVLFEELLKRCDSFELTGDIARLRQTMVPGVKHMPVRLHERRA